MKPLDHIHMEFLLSSFPWSIAPQHHEQMITMSSNILTASAQFASWKEYLTNNTNVDQLNCNEEHVLQVAHSSALASPSKCSLPMHKSLTIFVL